MRTIWLSEHHGDQGGWTSAPITLAAAILSATQTIRVSIAALIAPLHNPVRLAEQLATVDCIAPGRLSVTLGAGYRKAEFAMAGVDREARAKLMEESIDVLHAAWQGTSFEWRGRSILVAPPPATPGGPKLLLGGKSIAAARRARQTPPPILTWQQQSRASHVIRSRMRESRLQGINRPRSSGARDITHHDHRPTYSSVGRACQPSRSRRSSHVCLVARRSSALRLGRVRHYEDR